MFMVVGQSEAVAGRKKPAYNSETYNTGVLLQLASFASQSGEGYGTLLATADGRVATWRQDVGNGITGNGTK